jgi:hypothetical protein
MADTDGDGIRELPNGKKLYQRISPVITVRMVQTAIEYSFHLGVLMLTVLILFLPPQSLFEQPPCRYKR